MDQILNFKKTTQGKSWILNRYRWIILKLYPQPAAASTVDWIPLEYIVTLENGGINFQASQSNPMGSNLPLPLTLTLPLCVGIPLLLWHFRFYCASYCIVSIFNICSTVLKKYILRIVMGWQNRSKFIGKTNRLKISLQNAYLYYFVWFSDIW